MRVIAGVVALLLLLAQGQANAQGGGNPDDELATQEVVVFGMVPLKNGKYVPKLLGEAQEVRKVIAAGLERTRGRKAVNHEQLVDILGESYLEELIACRSRDSCVLRLLGPLKGKFAFALFGDYQLVKGKYKIRLWAVDLAEVTIMGSNEPTFGKDVLEQPDRWRRAIGPLLPKPQPKPKPKVEVPPPDGGEGEGEGEGEPADTGPQVAVLEDIPLEGAGTSGPVEASAFIDSEELDAQDRGAIWHGHFQQYFAVGLRHGFENEFLIMEDRLQLDFDAPVAGFRMIGRPQLLFDWMTKRFEARFREVFAVRQTDNFELSFGERILTWGVTDFWPVVDILNPRDFTTLRNWRPIDEKRPTLALRAIIQSGKFALELLALPLLASSTFTLDRTKAFGLPIPQSAGGIAVDIGLQSEDALSPTDLGGGIRVKYTVGDWAMNAYGLVGRDVLPTAALLIANPVIVMPEVEVFNQRLAMGAFSLQGSLDSVNAILKTEAAVYLPLDDTCEGQRTPPSLPGCTYLRRTPDARGTLGIEKSIMSGLDAHVQLIAEATRSDRIHKIPPRIAEELPGFQTQRTVNPIATLRLQGRFRKDNFRPMLFAYWAALDKDMFVNLDLEYHIADGMALAVGGMWFDGYRRRDVDRVYTYAGSQEKSSNVYTRFTAWF